MNTRAVLCVTRAIHKAAGPDKDACLQHLWHSISPANESLVPVYTAVCPFLHISRLAPVVMSARRQGLRGLAANQAFDAYVNTPRHGYWSADVLSRVSLFVSLYQKREASL